MQDLENMQYKVHMQLVRMCKTSKKVSYEKENDELYFLKITS